MIPHFKDTVLNLSIHTMQVQTVFLKNYQWLKSHEYLILHDNLILEKIQVWFFKKHKHKHKQKSFPTLSALRCLYLTLEVSIL